MRPEPLQSWRMRPLGPVQDLCHFLPTKQTKYTSKRLAWCKNRSTKTQYQTTKKAHVVSEATRILKNELAGAVKHSKDYYFEIWLPNFIWNNHTKFWNDISEKGKPISELFVIQLLLIRRPVLIISTNTFTFVYYFSQPCTTTAATTSYLDANFISYHGIVSIVLNLK